MTDDADDDDDELMMMMGIEAATQWDDRGRQKVARAAA